MAEKLSKEARDALVNAKNSNGYVRASFKVEKELKAAGLVGSGGGLTRTGSIAQERATEQMLNEMFG